MTEETELPLPPQGEKDHEGRWVHPYVREPSLDLSVRAYTLANGEVMDEEMRSRESRWAFHAIESLLGHLSPTGCMVLMQSLMHRLYSEALTEQMAEIGTTPEWLDPRGEMVPFEANFSERLRLILEHVEGILERCPRCGRRFSTHQDGDHE